jgi:hypothetical protein
VVIAELFDRRRLEPVRFVDDEQFNARPAALAQLGEVLIDPELPLDAPDNDQLYAIRLATGTDTHPLAS